MRTEQEMFDMFLKIAKEDKRIRAVYIHGSRANSSVKTDRYSDYDIVFVVTEIGSFANDREWLNNFGDIAYAFEAYRNHNLFSMKTINDLSRRCCWMILCKDGNHIDLMIEVTEEAMNHAHIHNKPTIVLLDKDRCLPEIPTSSNEDYYVKKPCEDEYTACCTGFWWFFNSVAKGIVRDQLPYAKQIYNFISLPMLNRMIEWFIGAQNDFSVTTGTHGKYYKKYLSADIYELYTKIYSDGDYKNFWNAVIYACELFSKTASGVGEHFGFTYNKQEENSMINHLKSMQNEIY